jgi:predicted anti-sigma-YlaC factor YlaD
MCEESCEIITKKISGSIDHKLTLKERMTIRIHITFCKFCRRYYRQLTMMHHYFEGRLKEEKQSSPPAGPGLSQEAKDRIKKNLRENTE